MKIITQKSQAWWAIDCKKFDILAINLSVLDNYVDGSTKLFSDLYLAKFLEIKINYNNEQI